MEQLTSKAQEQASLDRQRDAAHQLELREVAGLLAQKEGELARWENERQSIYQAEIEAQSARFDHRLSQTCDQLQEKARQVSELRSALHQHEAEARQSTQRALEKAEQTKAECDALLKEFLVLEHNFFCEVLEHTYRAFDEALCRRAKVRTQYTQTPGYEASEWSETESCAVSQRLHDEREEAEAAAVGESRSPPKAAVRQKVLPKKVQRNYRNRSIEVAEQRTSSDEHPQQIGHKTHDDFALSNNMIDQIVSQNQEIVRQNQQKLLEQALKRRFEKMITEKAEKAEREATE